MRHYDLIVCGGGLAGTAAAIAAGRNGLKVLIIEKNGFLGGCATNCLVNPFMDYIRKDGELINHGIFGEILKNLKNLDGFYYGNEQTFNEEILKIVLDDMCLKSGVDVLFHCSLCNADVCDKKITAIKTYSKSGIIEFSADYFIDATGDGDLSVMSDCQYEMGNKEGFCQPMTLCFRLSGVDRTKYAPTFAEKQVLHGLPNKEISKEVIALYNQFQKEGKIKNIREDVLTFPHMSDDIIHFNSTRVIKKFGTDVFDLSEAEREARIQMLELYKFMKENISGFENSSLLMSGSEIGVRETRRIMGEYLVDSEELLACKKFHDSVVRGIYNIDVHNPTGTGTLIKAIPEDDYYTIPYRSMVVKGKDNLLVVGRCISTTHEANSAIRVMPITTCMGEAAGYATKLAIDANAPFIKIDIEKLHKKIEDNNGVY